VKEATVRAKKSLGQHFLVDLNIARKIAGAIHADVTQQSGAFQGAFHENPVDVLEIGGGMGVLTQFLLERDDIRLWGIEIDRESIAYMREHFPTFSPRLIEGDFLRFDLRSQFPDGVKIIGNFPYNISSQIFFKVLENRDIVPEVVGMVQREVALRIAEPPGSRTYGILSVLLQAWYDIEYLFTVSESVFSPPPKVKSAVVRLTRNSTTELGCDEALFVRVVKAAFGQRRKMLRNALRSGFGGSSHGGVNGAAKGTSRTDGFSSAEGNGKDSNRSGDPFGGAEHPFFSRRAETLSVAEFVELTNWVEAHSN
jgi:16S rRNA (adenine1518-N6/adenine1519-N6)-dimethyltransferase